MQSWHDKYHRTKTLKENKKELAVILPCGIMKHGNEIPANKRTSPLSSQQRCASRRDDHQR
jgi:hypothetical protein